MGEYNVFLGEPLLGLLETYSILGFLGPNSQFGFYYNLNLMGSWLVLGLLLWVLTYNLKDNIDNVTVLNMNYYDILDCKFILSLCIEF